jgi:hypothetical protein
MPYRIINDGAAVASEPFSHITPEGPQICRCDTLEETKAPSQHAAGGIEVSAVGWESTVFPEPFVEE